MLHAFPAPALDTFAAVLELIVASFALAALVAVNVLWQVEARSTCSAFSTFDGALDAFGNASNLLTSLAASCFGIEVEVWRTV